MSDLDRLFHHSGQADSLILFSLWINLDDERSNRAILKQRLRGATDAGFGQPAAVQSLLWTDASCDDRNPLQVGSQEAGGGGDSGALLPRQSALLTQIIRSVPNVTARPAASPRGCPMHSFGAHGGISSSGWRLGCACLSPTSASSSDDRSARGRLHVMADTSPSRRLWEIKKAAPSAVSYRKGRVEKGGVGEGMTLYVRKPNLRVLTADNSTDNHTSLNGLVQQHVQERLNVIL